MADVVVETGSPEHFFDQGNAECGCPVKDAIQRNFYVCGEGVCGSIPGHFSNIAGHSLKAEWLLASMETGSGSWAQKKLILKTTKRPNASWLEGISQKLVYERDKTHKRLFVY